jgi:hypothetical protein
MDPYMLRERAWEDVALGNFETADLLMRRAFELEHAPAEATSTEVVL